jgi:hypothetical protein
VNYVAEEDPGTPLTFDFSIILEDVFRAPSLEAAVAVIIGDDMVGVENKLNVVSLSLRVLAFEPGSTSLSNRLARLLPVNCPQLIYLRANCCICKTIGAPRVYRMLTDFGKMLEFVNIVEYNGTDTTLSKKSWLQALAPLDIHRRSESQTAKSSNLLQ